MKRNRELLEGIQRKVEELPIKDEKELDAIKKKTKMLIRNIFGDTSEYLADLDGIWFYPPMGEDSDNYWWLSGQGKLLNLLSTMIEEINLFGLEKEIDTKTEQKTQKNDVKSVFIVHGHNEEMKLAVARTTEKLGLDAIILHEQPNQGRTIIEKFTDYGSSASFAIVLLSPDDELLSGSLRARQNVILELGFFIGRMGRSNVLVLFKEAEKFEMPSDISGVLYVPFDKHGNWQFQLVKELQAAGHNVDANVLMS